MIQKGITKEQMASNRPATMNPSSRRLKQTGEHMELGHTSPGKM